MKKFLLYCLVIVIAMALIVYQTNGLPVKEAFHAEDTSATTEAEVETTPVTIATEPVTEPDVVTENTEPAMSEGKLYLTISKLTFSLVGESEDIYCGSIPRDVITWGSADESIAVVENGVVTVVGAGETTVYAEYGDQRLECIIGCLAQTQEELNALSLSVLHSPKKIPPVGDGQPCTYYDDAVIIGDSVSYALMLWATQTGELSDATFLVRGGNGINGYVMGYKTIGFQGAERSLEEAVGLSGAKKAFIMMGVNDLGYLSVEETVEKLGILIQRIREKSPGIEIYLESCLPVWDGGNQGTKNNDVDAYNEALIQFCQENNCHYVEMASYLKDHTGGMAESYCADFTTHLNYDGVDAWMQAMKLYGYTQSLEEK